MHLLYRRGCRSERIPFVVRVKRREAPRDSEEEDMKYVLAFIGDRDRMKDRTEDEMRAAMEAWNAFDKEAVDAGALIACEPLEESAKAFTIRIADDDERTTTDGPFAETKEQLGGFALLECKDFDEAMEWAAKVPVGPGTAIEVRAVMDLSPFGYQSSTVSPAKARATA
jgi:hypothetical protein